MNDELADRWVTRNKCCNEFWASPWIPCYCDAASQMRRVRLVCNGMYTLRHNYAKVIQGNVDVDP
jgi:hypothetical protein